MVDNMKTWSAIINLWGNKPGEVRCSYKKRWNDCQKKKLLVLIVKYNRKFNSKTRENPVSQKDWLSCCLLQLRESANGITQDVTCIWELRKECLNQSQNQQAGKKTYPDYCHPGLSSSRSFLLYLMLSAGLTAYIFFFFLFFFSLFSFPFSLYFLMNSKRIQTTE